MVAAAADEPVPVFGIAGGESLDLGAAGLEVEHVFDKLIAFGVGIGVADDGEALARVGFEMLGGEFHYRSATIFPAASRATR